MVILTRWSKNIGNFVGFFFKIIFFIYSLNFEGNRMSRRDSTKYGQNIAQGLNWINMVNSYVILIESI